LKAVIDEGVPRQLVESLRMEGVDAFSFPMEWRGIANGALMKLVEDAGYAVFVTNDRNMAHQQHIGARRFAILALPSNKRSVIVSRAADIAEMILMLRPGQQATINMDGLRSVFTVVDGKTVVASLPPLRPFR
jgi:predicted nuclease of predicted toxin-antitoxin system